MGKKKLTLEEVGVLVERVLREYTDSLGQTHGSDAFDQNGDFANTIYAAMRAIDAKLNDGVDPEEIDDYNDQQAYLALKRVYDALDELIHLQSNDY